MTCPTHGELPANAEVWITTFPGNREEEEEGRYVCPECLAELDD